MPRTSGTIYPDASTQVAMQALIEDEHALIEAEKVMRECAAEIERLGNRLAILKKAVEVLNEGGTNE